MKMSLLIQVLLLMMTSAMAEMDEILVDERDGKTYKTVKIGSQIWMAENLNYETDNSFCYGDSSNNCIKYGRLYTWNAATSVCPEGWRLPSKDEFKILFELVGGKSTAGLMLKSKAGWNDDGDGSDDFGFSALPAGARYYFDGVYYGLGEVAGFWSSTEGDSYNPCRMGLYYKDDDAGLYHNMDDYGYSVRCLQDQ